MRAVVDVNVLVRALIKPDGSVGPIMRRMRDGDFTLLYSDAILAELLDVLQRPRIRSKYHLADQDIETVLLLILLRGLASNTARRTLRGEAVSPNRRIRACRDPRDDPFLEVAVAGRADAIVSGDEDLLTLHPFEGIPIVRPAEFLQMLPSSAQEVST